MHSFQPSRGRVFFEVLCALGMSASFAGAWLQTQATALLGAAGIAALYGLVHLFDMRRPKSAMEVEPQRVEFAPEAADIVVPMVTAGVPEAAELAVEEAAAAEPAARRSGEGRRSGGSRKGSGRRTKTPKAAKAAEPAPVEETDVPWPMAEEPEVESVIEPGLTVDEDFAFLPEGDAARSHIEPLFEPEPFARMPRQAFGRRGRI
jgi:hypothetical protein